MPLEGHIPRVSGEVYIGQVHVYAALLADHTPADTRIDFRKSN